MKSNKQVTLNSKQMSHSSNTKEISSFRRSLPQILAVLVKNSLLFVYGTSVGMPTILIPSLDGSNANEAIFLDREGISWIGSLNNLCVPIGCLFSGAITQPLGRKRSLQLVSLPYFAAFLLYHFSTKPWQIFLGLALTGTSGGLIEAPALSYTAETTEPHLRGALTTTSTLSISLGIIMTFILGTFLPWRTVALINSIVPLVGFVVLILLPESPYWLISRNRLEEGQTSLAWLRGWTTLDKVEKEFLAIQEDIQRHTVEKKGRTFINVETIKLYFKASFIIPFLLIALTFVIGHFGKSPITVYAVTIFNMLHVPISSYYATIIVGCIDLTGCTLCVFVVRFLGKRFLTFTSLIGVSVCFCIAAAYSYSVGINHFDTMSTKTEADSYSWIPLVSLVSMGFFSYLMIISLPWILMGEIYYNEVRDAASGFSAATGYLIGFIANKTFLNLVSLVTLSGVFCFYSSVAIIGAILLYFLLPETEGKTLFEISEHYAGRSKLDNKVLRNKSKECSA